MTKAMNPDGLKIGQLCTCDVDNFGDLLYPIIFQKLVAKEGIRSAVVPLSFFQGAAPSAAGYEVQGIRTVLKSRRQVFSRLVIGGGDILRTDVDTLATHYQSQLAARMRDHFWMRMKKRIFGKSHLTNEFNKTVAGYSPIAPFILDRANHPNVGPIAYCSCGVPFRFHPKDFPAIRAAFEAAAFVYVRDSPSAAKLREAGGTRDIEVSPDLIVTLSDFADKDEERRKGIALLASHGVDTKKDIICFQSCPQTPEKEAQLLEQLTTLKKKSEAEIILLPMGYCHGDDLFLQNLAERSNGDLVCVNTRSIHAIISVIAACKLFVGTSMHGNITAFSYGIPHLFGPIPVAKIEGFLNAVKLDTDFQLESWLQLADRQAAIRRLPQDYFAIRADAAKRAVYQTLRNMFKALEQAEGKPQV